MYFIHVIFQNVNVISLPTTVTLLMLSLFVTIESSKLVVFHSVGHYIIMSFLHGCF